MTFTQTKWNLSGLYSGFDTPELHAAFDNIEEQVTSFEGVRGKLKPDRNWKNYRLRNETKNWNGKIHSNFFIPVRGPQGASRRHWTLNFFT